VRLALADQPFLRVPGIVGAPAGDALDAAAGADILIAEADEFTLRPDLDVEEAARAARARLGAADFGGPFAGWGHGKLPIALDETRRKRSISSGFWR
jgi:hypothetical protein